MPPFEEIAFFGEDPSGFIYMLIRFGINILLTFLITGVIYKAKSNRNEYVFTFFVFNVLIFFVCHLMANTQLGIGFAFGLFALFSILRYRTTTIQIKEMTYLFSVVCIAVINALGQMSLAEWFFADLAILVTIFSLENVLFKTEVLSTKKIIFNDLELIRPTNKELLIKDLRMKTGLDIQNVEVGTIDLETGKANLTVYY